MLQKKPCYFSRLPWARIAAVSAIFICVLTLSLISGDRGSADPGEGIRLQMLRYGLIEGSGYFAVVPGWEPDKNLMVGAFVNASNFVSLAGSSSVCASPLLLLIIVCSNPANYPLRMAIRLTWASLRDSSIQVVFLLGHVQDSAIQDRIQKENEMYADIIQENFIDSYNNLTIKSVMMLKWFTQNCKQTKFLLKTDDDLFLDYRVVSNSLREPFPEGISPENLLGGTIIRGARPVQDSTDKWFMPSYLYNEKSYPNYLSGVGYLMSNQVAEKLFKASLEVKMIHMEDIYITGLCAQKAGIKRIPLFGFTFSKTQPFTCNSRYFMSHRVTPDEMFDAWTRYSACSSTYVKSIFQDKKFGLWQKVQDKLQIKNR